MCFRLFLQCCDNENLLEPVPPGVRNGTRSPDDVGNRFFEDGQLTSAGTRRLARNWDSSLRRISRDPEDGKIVFRRPSDSGSTLSDATSAGLEEGNAPRTGWN